METESIKPLSLDKKDRPRKLRKSYIQKRTESIEIPSPKTISKYTSTVSYLKPSEEKNIKIEPSQIVHRINSSKGKNKSLNVQMLSTKHQRVQSADKNYEEATYRQGITFNNLTEGEKFDTEINRIVSIINNVEREFGQKNVNQRFQEAIRTATYQRRLFLQHEEAVTQTQILNITKQKGSLGRNEVQKSLMPSTYATLINANNTNHTSIDFKGNQFYTPKPQFLTKRRPQTSKQNTRQLQKQFKFVTSETGDLESQILNNQSEHISITGQTPSNVKALNQNQDLQTVRSHSSSKMGDDKRFQCAEKVLVKVNKYIHPVQRIPQLGDPEIIRKWQFDYENNIKTVRIGKHLKDYDGVILGLLVGLEDSGHQSRLVRYQQKYLQQDCAELNEDLNARKLFFDDLDQIRNLVIKIMNECMSGTIALEEDFAKKRSFFMNKLITANQKREELEKTIEQLQDSLEKEKDYNLKIFVDEKVSQLCQKAYFSYEQLRLEQSNAQTEVPLPQDSVVSEKVNEIQTMLDYEKKMSHQLIQILEKKLTCSVTELKNLQKQLAVEIEAKNQAIEGGQQFKNSLQGLMMQISQLKIENERLNTSHQLSGESQKKLENYEKLVLKNELCQSDLRMKNNQVSTLKVELEQMKLCLKDCYIQTQSTQNEMLAKYKHLDAYTKHMTHEFSKKFTKVMKIVSKIILYGDKAHFLQEINRQKDVQTLLERKLEILQNKYNLNKVDFDLASRESQASQLSSDRAQSQENYHYERRNSIVNDLFKKQQTVSYKRNERPLFDYEQSSEEEGQFELGMKSRTRQALEQIIKSITKIQLKVPDVNDVFENTSEGQAN